MSTTHLLGLDASEFSAWCDERGLPGYRTEQILQWVYRRGAEAFEQMSNLPKALRGELAGCLPIYQSRIARRSESKDGVVKLLLVWPDQAGSECVLIPERRRRTACLSTQVGCPIGCAFCASGLGGLQRNLTAGQIVEQALRLARGAGPDSGDLTHVVLMGIGEPLANYDAVVRAIRIINAPWGLGIGARRITLSTVGLPTQIRRLAREKLQINLAISLHAPTDALRRELVPAAQSTRMAQVVEAAAYYFQQTGREITLEYVLLADVNDRLTHAEELAGLARKIRCNVNLIRYNPVAELPYQPAGAAAVKSFVSALRRHGVNVHVRASRGGDIEAACGQLRLREAAPQPISQQG